MPLITPQRKPRREPITLRLDVQLIALLKGYSEYIASGTDYVVSQALLIAFGKDPDFLEWLRANRPADAGTWQDVLAQATPRTRTRARRAVSEAR